MFLFCGFVGLGGLEISLNMRELYGLLCDIVCKEGCYCMSLLRF